jgi:hypothetical protein
MTDHYPSCLLCARTQSVKTKSPDTKSDPIFRYVGVKGVGSGLLDDSTIHAGFFHPLHRFHLEPIVHPLSNRKGANPASFVKYFSTFHN